MVIGIKVINRTQSTVWCAVTTNTKPSGQAGWFGIEPGASDTWERPGWEDVQFKNSDNTLKKSLRINRGGPALVYFDGFEKEIVVYNDYKPEGSFVVRNRSNTAVSCWISTTSGGSGEWYVIMPGESEVWRRTGWETVAFKSAGDMTRKGIYVDNRGTQAMVDFHGFDKNITVEHTSSTFLSDEHYAEAIRIADRCNASQNTKASSAGGLMASIYKIDTLERLSTGFFPPFFGIAHVS